VLLLSLFKRGVGGEFSIKHKTVNVMKFTATIDVMPLKELLDPQGKAVEKGLKNLALDSVQSVRIGKHIVLEIEAADEAAAKVAVEKACEKLLHNPVMESFTYTIK
jgi:phosphoribosylformylglycinamidine synthase PurS subunit